jgi:hypothetical protein
MEAPLILGDAKQCIGCQAVGVPEPGYRFYVCIPCLDGLCEVLALAEAGALAGPSPGGMVS